MSSQFSIEAGTLPPTFRGTWQEFADQLPSLLTIRLNDGKSVFSVGQTEPNGDQGPWLKGGTRWFVYDLASGGYIPAKVNPLLRRIMIQTTDPVDGISGNDEDDDTESVANGDMWIQTTDNGELDSLKVRVGNEWKTLTYSLVERTNFLEILNNLPTYIQEQVSLQLSGIESTIEAIQQMVNSVSVIEGPPGPAGPQGPQGPAGAGGSTATVDLSGPAGDLNDLRQAIEDLKTTVEDTVGLQLTQEQLDALAALGGELTDTQNKYTAVNNTIGSQETRIKSLETDSALLTNGPSAEVIANIKATVLDAVYPIGTIIELYNNSGNPATLMDWPESRWNSDIGAGRFLLAANGTYPAGFNGGTHEVTLTAAQSGLRAHTHDFQFGGTAARTSTLASSGRPNAEYPTLTTVSVGEMDALEPHTNMPPWIAVYRWRREQ